MRSSGAFRSTSRTASASRSPFSHASYARLDRGLSLVAVVDAAEDGCIPSSCEAEGATCGDVPGGCGAILGLKPVQQELGLELGAAEIGLGTLALTCALMVIGSLVFPEDPSEEEGS